jgi:hypothetical protein
MPVAVVISTQLARRSFEKVQLRGQAITVKGYAERKIVSDYGIWNATLTTRDADLAKAYKELESHRDSALAYLAQSGFDQQAVKPFTVSIEKAYARDAKNNPTNQIEYFIVSQALQIDSNDVRKIATVATGASDLINRGIELNAAPPRFFYTKLDAMKLQMLGEASENSRQRASQLIASGSGKLGVLRSASQGVFQITDPLTTEASGSGENDTSSVDKVIKAVVTCEYAID